MWTAGRWPVTVKSISPATPVILLTGWGQRLVAEGDVPAHVDKVLNKPPKLRELREALALCQLAARMDVTHGAGSPNDSDYDRG